MMKALTNKIAAVPAPAPAAGNGSGAGAPISTTSKPSEVGAKVATALAAAADKPASPPLLYGDAVSAVPRSTAVSTLEPTLSSPNASKAISTATVGSAAGGQKEGARPAPPLADMTKSGATPAAVMPSSSSSAIKVKHTKARSSAKPPLFPPGESITSSVLKAAPRLVHDDSSKNSSKPLSAAMELKVRQYNTLLQKGVAALVMQRAKSSAQLVLDSMMGGQASTANPAMPESSCFFDAVLAVGTRKGKNKMQRLAGVKRERSEDEKEEEEGIAVEKPQNTGGEAHGEGGRTLLSGSQKARRRRSSAALEKRNALRIAKLEERAKAKGQAFV